MAAPSKSNLPNAFHALHDCCALAAQHRDQDWAKSILRTCAAAGVVPSPIKGGDVVTVDTEHALVEADSPA